MHSVPQHKQGKYRVRCIIGTYFWHTDSQGLTLCALSGLVRVPLEEQLKFGRPKAGGDDKMSHIMQTWVRVGAG